MSVARSIFSYHFWSVCISINKCNISCTSSVNDSIQKSNIHDSGFALRFPRIKNIREDKNVSDIDSLQKVKQIYEKQAYIMNKAPSHIWFRTGLNDEVVTVLPRFVSYTTNDFDNKDQSQLADVFRNISIWKWFDYSETVRALIDTGQLRPRP